MEIEFHFIDSFSMSQIQFKHSLRYNDGFPLHTKIIYNKRLTLLVGFLACTSSLNAIGIIDYAICIFWAQKLELKLEQLRLKTLSLSRASRNQDLIPRIIWRNTLMKQKIQSSRKDSFRWGNSFYLTSKSTNILYLTVLTLT